jgi:hypothetical protein
MRIELFCNSDVITSFTCSTAQGTGVWPKVDARVRQVKWLFPRDPRPGYGIHWPSLGGAGRPNETVEREVRHAGVDGDPCS